MADKSADEPRRIIPALGPFYDNTRDISWLLVRLTAGGFLLIHGIQKVTLNSIAGFAANSLARRGIEPSVPLAYAVFFLETVGALCIIFGLFTRLFAAAIGIQFLMIVFNFCSIATRGSTVRIIMEAVAFAGTILARSPP